MVELLPQIFPLPADLNVAKGIIRDKILEKTNPWVRRSLVITNPSLCFYNKIM